MRPRPASPSSSGSTIYPLANTSAHIATSDNIVVLAAAAGATDRINLMSGIVPVPLYPPALLAKQPRCGSHGCRDETRRPVRRRLDALHALPDMLAE